MCDRLERVLLVHEKAIGRSDSSKFPFLLFVGIAQMTMPLVNYYERKGAVKTFQGTKSDIIYPEVKKWLEERGYIPQVLSQRSQR
jgi:hypothetical protein